MREILVIGGTGAQGLPVIKGAYYSSFSPGLLVYT